jgi:hypothetical protein
VVELVLNEWVWADLSGQNGQGRQKDVVRLILKLQTGTDRVVVVKGSAFQAKLWRATKSSDPIEIEGARVFKSIVFDADRCRLIQQSDLAPAPDPPICKDDDLYLVRAQATVADSVVVSTDGDLIDAIRRTGGAAEHRDAWLGPYLAR